MLQKYRRGCGSQIGVYELWKNEEPLTSSCLQGVPKFKLRQLFPCRERHVEGELIVNGFVAEVIEECS